jgi:hypothetical protein
LSETPHNARCDAIALRDYVLEQEGSLAPQASLPRSNRSSP